jgi:hypothetical protein
MDDLVQQAKNFADVLTKSLPKAQFKAYSLDDLSEVNRSLNLSKELLTWYTTAAPLNFYIPMLGNPLILYDPNSLTDGQYGYRWIGKSAEENMQWNPDWIVIGDIGADPIIAHINERATPISASEHGMGKWELRPVSPDLGNFLDIVSFWADYSINQMGRVANMVDEDSNWLDAIQSAVKTGFSKLTTEEYLNNVLWLFGFEEM